jgi:hypothetical protein
MKVYLLVRNDWETSEVLDAVDSLTAAQESFPQFTWIQLSDDTWSPDDDEAVRSEIRCLDLCIQARELHTAPVPNGVRQSRKAAELAAVVEAAWRYGL